MTTIGVFLLTGALFCEHPTLQYLLGAAGLLTIAWGIALTLGAT